MCLDGHEHRLQPTTARRLADDLDDATAGGCRFVHTTGEYRADGSYAVARRGATTAGNATTFDSFADLERLYERLPATFDAEAVGDAGITGSRRHMVVRHLAEHPAFGCRLTAENPLTAAKTDDGSA